MTDRVAPEELVEGRICAGCGGAGDKGYGLGSCLRCGGDGRIVTPLERRAAQHITRLEGENKRLRLAARFAADWFEAPSEDGELVLDQLNAALSNSTKEGTDD